MDDSPIAGANAHASSGLGGAAATGDGDSMTQVGISAMSSAFFVYEHRHRLPSAFRVQFFVLHITVADPRKEAVPGEAVSVTACYVHPLVG